MKARPNWKVPASQKCFVCFGVGCLKQQSAIATVVVAVVAIVVVAAAVEQYSEIERPKTFPTEC